MMLQKPVGRMSQRVNSTIPKHSMPIPSPITLDELWAGGSKAFQQAGEPPNEVQQYFYCLSNHIICLRIASAALATQLTPALAHLATAPHAAPALTINLWDTATTGVALPPLPATMQQPAPSTEQWGSYVHSERFQAFWQPAYQLFTMLNRQQNEGLYWVQDARRVPLAEGGAPLLTLFHWWLGQQERQIVHGAAVGTDAGGALLVGKSGAGKSTAALASLNAGLYYLGDDYCLVAAAPTPTVYSLYSSGKVHFADLSRFPRLQKAHSTNSYADADKMLYFFADAFANQIFPSLPLKAMLLPTIGTSSTSRAHEISPAAALLALGPSTIFQLTGQKQQAFQHLGQLVRQLPCYRLELGPDIAQTPVLITEILAKL